MNLIDDAVNSAARKLGAQATKEFSTNCDALLITVSHGERIGSFTVSRLELLEAGVYVEDFVLANMQFALAQAEA